MDAVRFGSIHTGDDSHRRLGYRRPVDDMPVWSPKRTTADLETAAFASTAAAAGHTVWSTAMDAMRGDTRASRKARKAPFPVCVRKLKSKAGVNTHRKAVGH